MDADHPIKILNGARDQIGAYLKPFLTAIKTMSILRL